MITEDYVSFETAKLLKEKGFGNKILSDGRYAEQCGTSYDVYTGEFLPHCAKHQGQVNAPTLQMAMKWLREVHHLIVEPYYSEVLNWVVDIKHIGRYTHPREFESVRENCFFTYEEACETAIKYCLKNLI